MIKTRKPKVLVGDDQHGADDTLRQGFLLDYRNLADFEFTDNPNKFIQMARNGNYDALMIDLKWDKEDYNRDYKTGYRILDNVRDCSPIRILWTSENEELREKGYQYGATHCIPKGIPPRVLDEILLG